MDTRSGEIHTFEAVAAMNAEDQKYMRPMALDPTPLQRRTGKVGRNDPCPCGSGQKLKRCCLGKRPGAR
jgi:uncharacterized protein YecA (UPF0149 family)